MADLKCSSCTELTEEEKGIATLCRQLARGRFKGRIEIHFDGAGPAHTVIVEQRQLRKSKILLTSHR